MSTQLKNAVTNRICPRCKGEFHRDEFGYQRGNGGEKKCKPYCPECTKKYNAEACARIKRANDPFYCGF